MSGRGNDKDFGDADGTDGGGNTDDHDEYDS